MANNFSKARNDVSNWVMVVASSQQRALTDALTIPTIDVVEGNELWQRMAERIANGERPEHIGDGLSPEELTDLGFFQVLRNNFALEKSFVKTVEEILNRRDAAASSG